MRIAFLGLGLIGGSIARALRAADLERAGAFAGATFVAWTIGDGAGNQGHRENRRNPKAPHDRAPNRLAARVGITAPIFGLELTMK